jgi:hypothetical protein
MTSNDAVLRRCKASPSYLLHTISERIVPAFASISRDRRASPGSSSMRRIQMGWSFIWFPHRGGNFTTVNQKFSMAWTTVVSRSRSISFVMSQLAPRS